MLSLRYVLAALLVTTAAPAAAEDAQSLTAKNLEARGGAAALDAIKSISFEGRTIFPGDLELTFKQALARLGGSDAIRYDLGLQGLDLVQSYDGQGAWKINPFQGRATYSVADREAQFSASEQVKGMFLRMSKVVAQINALRGAVHAIASNATAAADVKAAAAQIEAKADAMRKEIVATTEGGAITGEERLRENVDEIFGAINSTEDRPTTYQMARIEALDRELRDVEAQWAAFQSGDLAAFNARLRAANLPPLTVAEVEFDPDDLARGGRASALARGLIGWRFYGDVRSLEESEEKD